MAKVPFSKLKLTKKDDTTTVVINEIEINVKQYLPAAEKFTLVENVLNALLEQEANNFKNPIKEEIFTNLEIVYAYSNLSFTDKQKEDIPKLYDLLESNGVIDIIIGMIPDREYNFIISAIEDTVDAYYKYKNSALGIMETIGTDYTNLNFDATEIQKKIGDPENLALLKDIVTKMG